MGVLNGIGNVDVADGFAVVHFGVVVYKGEVGAPGGRDRAEMRGDSGGLRYVRFAVGDVVVVEEFGGEAVGRVGCELANRVGLRERKGMGEGLTRGDHLWL